MRKQTLLASVSRGRIGWTPSEIRLGRLLRNPEGEHGGTGGGQENNSGGNSGGNGQSESNENNNGGEADYSSFWDQGAGDGTGSPESGSAGAGTPPAPQQQQNQQQQPQQSPIAQQLGQQLQGMKFEDLVTPEILESFGNGDPASFNQGLNGFGQAVARQTLGMTVSIMKHFRDEMMSEFETKMGGEFKNRENFSELAKAIPVAADESNPASKTVRDIYTRALERAKGNKAAAIQQTKDVMRLQAEAFGGDLGLDVAPRDPSGRGYQPPKATNWLEELSSPGR